MKLQKSDKIHIGTAVFVMMVGLMLAAVFGACDGLDKQITPEQGAAATKQDHADFVAEIETNFPGAENIRIINGTHEQSGYMFELEGQTCTGLLMPWDNFQRQTHAATPPYCRDI